MEICRDEGAFLEGPYDKGAHIPVRRMGTLIVESFRMFFHALHSPHVPFERFGFRV